MSAPSPRPKAFLGIGNYLLGKLCVAFSALTMYVIENNRLTETWRFGQADIARNHTLENLGAKKAAQIRGNLPRKRGPLVIHCQQNAFDLETGIQSSPDAHQRIQQFRYAFQR